MPSIRAAKIGPWLVLTTVHFAPAFARADEAFLCGPSSLVYVKSEDVEARKKTDPCVAAYFGLTVPPAATPALGPAAPAEAGQSRQAGAPAVRTIARPKADAAAAARPDFKTFAASETPETASAASHVSTAFLAPPVLPSPAPDTDFRNVRIINAEPGGEQWFKHVK